MNYLKCAVISMSLLLALSTVSYADITSDSASQANSMAVAGGGGGANVSVNPTLSLEQTFEAGKRPYPIPGQVEFSQLPGYFGDNNKPGHQFIPLDKLMMYDTTWYISDASEMLKSKRTGKRSNFVGLVSEVSADQRSESIICTKMPIDKNLYEVRQLAFGTVNATNKDSISADVLARVLVDASKYGATHIQFLAEGTNTELLAEGFGVGFNYTKATDSSVSTGGTGWSKGWAGYQNLPWMQFVVLSVVERETPIESDSGPTATVSDINTDESVSGTSTRPPLPVIVYDKERSVW